MKEIPVRHLNAPQRVAKDLLDSFSIRDLRHVLGGRIFSRIFTGMSREMIYEEFSNVIV